MLSARLRNQKLVGSSLRRPDDVVRWLGAVQAQDYIGAKWALALRGRGLSDAAVEQAFNDGRLVRTHVLRPTWHLVTPDDIGWMLALNASRLRRLNLTYAKRLELDANVLTRARQIVERALAGTPLTRAEIAAALRKGRIVAAGQRLAHLLFDLEQQAVICSGPRRGKLFTYALFSERVGSPPSKTRDEALAHLAQRYFQSHGPATLRDFAWWSGLTMADARRGVAAAGVEALDRPPELQHAAGATFLLPAYDEYLIAYRDRGAVIDPARARNLGVFTSQEFPHQLIVDGRVAGSWQRQVTGTALTIVVWPYRPLSSQLMKALQRQAARYGQFLGLRHHVRLA